MCLGPAGFVLGIELDRVSAGGDEGRDGLGVLDGDGARRRRGAAHGRALEPYARPHF
jgi:hypothetical protein